MKTLKVMLPNGTDEEVEMPESWTCVQAAHILAHKMGFQVFEWPWCLGIEQPTVGTEIVRRVVKSDMLVGELPEARYFLTAQSPRTTSLN